jgi:Holliday junction resolvase-like predicted endonuclease
MRSRFEVNPVFEIIQLAQCHNCKFANISSDKDCEIYGDKPREYLINESDCPSKIQDECRKQLDMLTENDVIGCVVKKLEKAGYIGVKALHTTEKGVDIIAKKDDVTVYIEAKGATSASKTSKRYGLPFSKNQVRNHIAVAFYTAAKTIQKFSQENNIFCIALPDNSNHRKCIGEIEMALDQLCIQIIWVTENKKTHLTEKLL